MRRDNNLVQCQQRVIGWHRLLDEDIERRSGDLARLDCRVEGFLIDQSATRAVDDPHAILHLCKSGLTDNAARLVGQRRMNSQEIGVAQYLVKRRNLDPGLCRDFTGDEWIVGDDLHRQPERPRGDDLSNIAQPDHAKRLPCQIDTHKALLVPLPGLELGVRLRDLPRQRHQE